MILKAVCAGLFFQFHLDLPSPFLSEWEWKIDPWKSAIPIQKQGKNVIEVYRERRSEYLPKKLSLVYREKLGAYECSVYRLINDYILWEFGTANSKRIYLRFCVDSTWNKITLLRDETNSQGCAAFEYLGKILPGVYLKHHLLTLHSALVEYNGRSLAICAPSGTGKTTHVRLWRDCKNALILNGDRAVIGKTEQGWTAYGTPWSGTSGEQINRHAPLHALVILERSEENSVEKLEGLQAFVGMMPHVLYPAWDRELAEIAIDGLNDMLSSIPVYRLCCRPEKEAVEVLYQALYEG